MALYKKIKQRDGVETNYHRIAFIQITPNKQNSIVVLSYTDQQAREGEKESVELNPYKTSKTYETDYSDGMTVKDAYNHIKALPDFDGAGDA